MQNLSIVSKKMYEFTIAVVEKKLSPTSFPIADRVSGIQRKRKNPYRLSFVGNSVDTPAYTTRWCRPFDFVGHAKWATVIPSRSPPAEDGIATCFRFCVRTIAQSHFPHLPF